MKDSKVTTSWYISCRKYELPGGRVERVWQCIEANMLPLLEKAEIANDSIRMVTAMSFDGLMDIVGKEIIMAGME